MSDTAYITWIDDQFINQENDRVKQAKGIEEAAGDNLSLQLIPFNEDGLQALLNQVNEHDARLPDILILDFRLAHANFHSFTVGVDLNDGYTLRKYFELTTLRFVPKYLVSATFGPAEAGPNIEGFEWILPNPGDGEAVAKQLIDDVSGYRYIKEFTAEHQSNQEQALAKLLSVTSAPESAHEELLSLLGHALGQEAFSADLKSRNKIDASGLDNESTALDFSRWFRGTLLVRLGPLIDSLSAANLLGASQQFFEQQLSQRLNDERHAAQYRGIFSRPEKPRWWRDEIIEWVAGLCDEITSGSIEHLAPLAANTLLISEDQRSKCSVCNEPWPDVVAYDIDDPTVFRQVHRHCSNSVEDQPFVTGFEELRYFDKD